MSIYNISFRSQGRWQSEVSLIEYPIFRNPFSVLFLFMFCERYTEIKPASIH